MSAITQCPECDTRFKVSQTQLEAYQGMVRCGHCQATFNAMQHLYDDQPSPQLSLPIGAAIAAQSPTVTAPDKNDAVVTKANNTAQLSSPLTLTQQFSVLKMADEVPRQPLKKRHFWLWVTGAFLLIILLLAQAGYFLRVEIAARLPGLKPVLTTYCDWLKCTIPLPKKAQLMSIESSDLEASPAQGNIIDLNVTLRNRAPYTQAYPNLELSLTDLSDNTLARRVFQPAEYLKRAEDEKQGLSATREISIKLHLDATDLKPTGYRIFLFYP